MQPRQKKMSKKIKYKTRATAQGGREGHVRSEDGTINLALIKPKELGKDGSAGVNPETLFASGYAACFESATRFAADKAGLKVGPESYMTKAEVGIGPRKSSGFQLDIRLFISTSTGWINRRHRWRQQLPIMKSALTLTQHAGMSM